MPFAERELQGGTRTNYLGFNQNPSTHALSIFLFVTFHALRRRLLALGVLHLVAIDTGAGLGRRTVERALPSRLHPRLRWFRVAVKAGLLGRLGRLFRPGRVMARLALVGCPFLVELVLELHYAER